MNDIEVTSIDLVEGGNVFKQGHYLTLGYVPRDEKGETVDLSGKTLNVSLWGRKGVVFESIATYSGGVIRFTLDKMVPAGDYTVEFTVTSSTDAKYRKKFPTNQHSGRIAIKQSADDLGVIGISVYTIEKFEKKQKEIQDAYQATVDEKVLELETEFDAAVSAVTVDSEVVIARGNEPTLNQRLQRDAAVIDTRLNETTQQLADTERVVNVRAHGAKGDGVTDDYYAIQGALVLAENLERSLYIPSGVYYVSQTLRTSHKTTPHYTRGIRIYGDGKNTRLIGTGSGVVDYSNLTTTSNGAILALHGGNNIVENMEFRQCTVGVFLGQDPRVSDSYSSVSFNIVENVWMEYVGTGILMVHASGNNYNKFKKIHVLNCQIGVHLGKGIYLNQFNNNRNTFEDIRVSRAWVGFLVEQADGNAFNGVYAENLVPGGEIGTRPSQLPAELGNKQTAVVVLDGQYNFFDKVGVENCDFHLYSVGFRTSFVNMMVRDDAASRMLIMFPDPGRQPMNYNSDSFITPFYTYQPDIGIHYGGSNGLGFKTRMFDIDYHWQVISIPPLSSDIQDVASASRSRMRRFANMVTWAMNARFTKTTASSKTSPIKIKIPYEEKLSIDLLYTNTVSTNATFSFPVYVGISGAMELVRGRFSTVAEATEYGGFHILVPAPAIGWHETLQANNVNFSLDFYAESK